MVGDGYQDISASYRSFKTLFEAGQPLLKTLDMMQAATRGPHKLAIHNLVLRIKSGSSLYAAMQAGKFPRMDIALIRVGETTGTLGDAMQFLSQYYSERYEIERTLKWALLKPGVLFIVSLFLRDLPNVFKGELSIGGYLFRTTAVLAVVGLMIYLAFKVFRLASQRPRLETFLNKFLLSLPWTRTLVEKMALERFFTTLYLTTRAGCDLDTMFNIAQSTTSVARIAQAASLVRRRAGKTGIGKAFESSGAFPRDYVNSIIVGEEAGELEAAYRNICVNLRDQIQQSLRLFEVWAPKVIYAMAALYAISGIFASDVQAL